ncbi:MAG TPA: sugar-binding protein, partial [Victivallales bacterium]|nr:sugar-binding protein [Victivallales bacterium]
GETSFSVICKENEKQVKIMPVAAFVRPGAIISAPALKGSPGETEINVTITNQGTNTLKNAKLKLELPDTWKAKENEYIIPEIKSNQKYDLKVSLNWSNSWPVNQKAILRLLGENDLDVTAPIIPSEYHIEKVKNPIKIDADLSDWAPETEMPFWMFGRIINDAEGKIFFAWAPEGLYCGVEVKNSRLINKSPGWFWACDALELFIDTKNDKSSRQFVDGDHQFWFVPLPDENRVYVGQWKRGSELPANREDIKNLKTAAKRKGEGYVMEFLLPATEMKNFPAKPGAKIGLNINLTVFGRPLQDEIYWPNSKASGLYCQPPYFGTVELKP